MTKKHIKYPVMGCVTDEELRDLSMGWEFEKLCKKIDGLNRDIERLEDLLLSISNQKKILMNALRKIEAKKYG